MFSTWVANATNEILADRERSYFVPDEIRERLLWVLDNISVTKDNFYDDALRQTELDTAVGFLSGFFSEVVDEAVVNFDRMRGMYINRNKFGDEYTKTGKPVTKSDALLDAEMSADEKFVKARIDLAHKKRFHSMVERLSWALKDRSMILDIFARKDR